MGRAFEVKAIYERWLTSRFRKFQGEAYDAFLAPIDDAKIEARFDLPDLIAHLFAIRGLRVIEDDALPAIEPALVLVNIGSSIAL